MLIEEFAASPAQTIQPATAYLITDMLSNVIEEGTARAARGMLKLSALAGKTGTSRDGWFVGYTPNLVCVVWIGYDDNRQLNLTGAESALPVWSEFVQGRSRTPTGTRRRSVSSSGGRRINRDRSRNGATGLALLPAARTDRH
jgi:membrane carboxypeptidase/penicillin-binding protein